MYTRISLLILNVDTTWREAVSLAPQAALPTEKAPSVPNEYGAGYTAEPVWAFWRK
jgi:hypothetical protein